LRVVTHLKNRAKLCVPHNVRARELIQKLNHHVPASSEGSGKSGVPKIEQPPCPNINNLEIKGSSTKITTTWEAKLLVCLMETLCSCVLIIFRACLDLLNFYKNWFLALAYKNYVLKKLDEVFGD
jgi:hypothetical protein